MYNSGIHVNGIEFPVVSMGQARLRVNLMPQHTHEHLDKFVELFEKCLAQSTKMMEKL
jgi:glycine C-acetyltransferase